MFDKIKDILGNDSLFYSLFLTLVAVTAYGLGQQSVIQPQNQAAAPVISMTQTELAQTANPDGSALSQLVGSKNGSKYHYLWCPGAKQIKEENKVYFENTEDARAGGYTPAANCDGLE